MVIEAIGRRLRLGVIGGGPGSVIGEFIASPHGWTVITTLSLRRSLRTLSALGNRDAPSACPKIAPIRPGEHWSTPRGFGKECCVGGQTFAAIDW